VYLGTCLLLGNEEVGDFTGALQRKLLRRKKQA
jgi:hypothetical protein